MTTKILIAYHKRADVLSDDILTPVHLGRALAKKNGCTDLEWMCEHMRGDDEGENISLKNPSYNELTAVYWAWKNYDALENPDYVGLMHYRRHFIFKESGKQFFETKKIGADYLEKLNYSKKNISDLLKTCDFIVNSPYKRKSVYEHFKDAHDARELDAAVEILSRLYPDYTDTAQKYLNGSRAFFYNMFIFPREIFFRYAEWIFAILSEYEKLFPAKRMYVSERLTGIFIQKLLDEGKKAVFLPTMFITGKKNFKSVVEESKKNLKIANRGFKNKLYAIKPLILFFMPRFVERAYRNRKA